MIPAAPWSLRTRRPRPGRSTSRGPSPFLHALLLDEFTPTSAASVCGTVAVVHVRSHDRHTGTSSHGRRTPRRTPGQAKTSEVPRICTTRGACPRPRHPHSQTLGVSLFGGQESPGQSDPHQKSEACAQQGSGMLRQEAAPPVDRVQRRVGFRHKPSLPPGHYWPADRGQEVESATGGHEGEAERRARQMQPVQRPPREAANGARPTPSSHESSPLPPSLVRCEPCMGPLPASCHCPK